MGLCLSSRPRLILGLDFVRICSEINFLDWHIESESSLIYYSWALKVYDQSIGWLTVANRPSLALLPKPVLRHVARRHCELGCLKLLGLGVYARRNDALKLSRLNIQYWYSMSQNSFFSHSPTHTSLSLSVRTCNRDVWTDFGLEIAQHAHTVGASVYRWPCTGCAGVLLSVAQSVSVTQHVTCPPTGSTLSQYLMQAKSASIDEELERRRCHTNIMT